MKKILLATTILLGLYSCGGSDSNEGLENELNPENVEKEEQITIEQGKQKLEDNSLDFLSEVDQFKSDDALTELKEIADILLLDDTGKSIGSKTFKNLNNLQSGKMDFIAFNSIAIDDASLIEDYNSETGIYLWNSTSEEFDKTGESDNIIYKVVYNSKNAELVISDFETATFSLENTEVPTSLKASLKIDSKEIFSHNYNASIDEGKYMPNSVVSIIKIGGLTMETSLTNQSNQTLEFENEISIYESKLMNYYIAFKGDFNEIDSNGDDISDETGVEDILDSSEFSMSFLDAKITGKVSEPSIIPEGDMTTEEVVNMLNENVLIDISISDESIAKGQFYVDEYEDGNQIFTEPNLRFLFSDDTTADFEAYFGEGFSSLEGKFDDVIDNYVTKFE